MIAKHLLSLEIINGSTPEVLTILDTSTYADGMTVSCPELLITAPGFTRPSLINVTEGFKLPLNACALELQSTGCMSNREVLPDGIYNIRYSIAPNDKVYVEYNTLRVTSLMNEYYERLCSMNMGTCEPTPEGKAAIIEMNNIKVLIDAAVAKVEYCNKPEEGMELYEYAKKKLNKLNCKVC